MNLVKQQNLFLRNEKSDKVYEVSLFQVDSDQYIVNFRYGRRGSLLREGTKTVFPVPMNEAEKVYQDLVQSKKKKGYSESMDVQESTPSVIITETNQQSAVEETITFYLKNLANGIPIDSNWKPSRIIWRAGELRIIEAHNSIASLVHTDDAQQKYACLWYCGRVRTSITKHILSDEPIDSTSLWYHIHRAGLVANGNSAAIKMLETLLPSGLQTALSSKNYDEYNKILESFIVDAEAKDIRFLLDSYLLSIHIPEIKSSLLQVLPMIPLVPNKWNIIRYIYKVAEMLEDAEVLGILYKRISNQQSYFNSNPYGGTYREGRYVKFIEILRSKKPSIAFSNKTKAYFERRNLRSLMKAGTMQSEYYCSLASSILIQYNESDRKKHPNAYHYTYNRESRSYNSTTYEYADIAHLSYVYSIMYSNGDRYGLDYGKLFNYKGERSGLTKREDAFPSLWDSYPTYLVKLLTDGRLKEVAEFGLFALKGRKDLSELISVSELAQCILSPFEEVCDFAIKQVRKIYDPQQPNIELLQSLVLSNNEKAQTLAFQLIEQNPSPVVGDLSFLHACIRSINPNIQSWIILNMQEGDFDNNALTSYMDTFISHINNLDFDKTKMQLDTLTEVFPNSFQQIDQQIIIDLIGKEKDILVLTGCTLFNKNKIPVGAIPYETINNLIQSENKSIQEQGLIMFSKLSDEELIERKNILFDLVISENANIRQIALDTIGRIGSSNKAFKTSSYLQLVNLLDEKYENEEIPNSIYELIKTSYAEQLSLLDANIDEYIVSDKREIHLLVLDYIQTIDLNDWPVKRIASLSNHDMKQVRVLCKEYYTEQVARIKYEKEDGIKILNTTWDDVRTFGEAYFDEHFSEKEWDPDLIIALCDNVSPAVQQYGIRVLGRYFKDEHGVKFLTELSQHPSSNLQLYTSNYLNKFAFNNMEILEEIQFYFNTVLHSRNKDTATRKRVLAFLDKQADEGPEYAAYVSSLLKRQKNTLAIMDHAQIVKTLFKIKKTYPEIETGINIMETEIRS